MRGHSELLKVSRPGWFWTLWTHLRSQERPRRHMRLVENLAVGGKRTVSLVECDGRRFLLGGSADAVHCIASLDSPLEVQEGVD